MNKAPAAFAVMLAKVKELPFLKKFWNRLTIFHEFAMYANSVRNHYPLCDILRILHALIHIGKSVPFFEEAGTRV